MTERLEWLGRETVLIWIATIVVVGGGGVLMGGHATSIGAGIAVSSGLYLGLEWWGHEESAEEAGGDRNRQQTPTKHN